MEALNRINNFEEWLNLKVTYFTYHSFTIKIELRRNLSVEINSSYRYDGENLQFEDFYVTLEDGTEIFPTTEAIQYLQTKAQEKLFELYFHEIERDYYANLVEDEKEHEW